MNSKIITEAKKQATANGGQSGKSSIVIALAGNPNAGKTTLFNALTGLRQKVANYPGVTVERKEGVWRLDGSEKTARCAEIVDFFKTLRKSLCLCDIL